MVAPDKDEDLGDVYELLGVEEDAGDKEVQAAYRRGSLKCHPDRNPDDPEAAEKFDRLTRAKDLLLDPLRRAAWDQKRRAKRDLEERFAQEGEKRRRLREDLEGRERSAGLEEQRQSAQLSRQKYAQADFAARLRAREAELAGRQAEVAAKAAEVRSCASEARVQVAWKRGGAALGAGELREALAAYSVRTVELTESGAVVQLASREDALRAVLECRERRHQLPFRVALATKSRPEEPAPEPVPAFHPAPEARPGGHAAAGAFNDWEAAMLDGLRGLARARQAATKGAEGSGA